ncbi:IQ domain-containing protein K isoform X8 [Rousettus aegyptiacus]|uniref:IQ domain-containing protein K isoform X8 n=1 Tax=Rousettus aegyptiacus TaxID=9407 RepID=UPI00168D655D|nr:IQ domain-containing protein K isoform X8 [Rousettus aegyptiacus]
MAAPQYVGSRTGQSEERAGSIESFVTSRRTLPAVSHVSFERPVSPGQVAEPPGKSMWEQICEEYEAELPTFPEVYKAKPEAVISVSPLEGTFFHGFNAEHLYSIPHLAKDSHITCTHVKSETADPETCSPKEYLETFIFPILLPGMASLLHQAKKEKCFERKRTKFIACDFLTEWLYKWHHDQSKSKEERRAIHRILLHSICGAVAEATPTATNPTLPPADRRGSRALYSGLLERLSDWICTRLLPVTPTRT